MYYNSTMEQNEKTKSVNTQKNPVWPSEVTQPHFNGNTRIQRIRQHQEELSTDASLLLHIHENNNHLSFEKLQEMAKKGATFYSGDEKISDKEAIQLVRKVENMKIEVIDPDSKNPVVKLSGC